MLKTSRWNVQFGIFQSDYSDLEECLNELPSNIRGGAAAENKFLIHVEARRVLIIKILTVIVMIYNG